MAVLRFVFATFCALIVAYTMLWGALAIWFKLPVADWAKWGAIAVYLFPGFVALLHLFTRKSLNALFVYAGAFAIVMVCWQTLQPPSDADWADELTRQVSGTMEGDMLTLDYVREFEWTSLTEKKEVWSERTYDLTKLETLDLFLSYWGDPRMAHFMLSFGFGNNEYLTWSIEVRRTKTGEYSPVADFFKANPLIIIAAQEQDVVGFRSQIWENDVHIFRLNTPKPVMREVLEAYVMDANHLAETPVWYNSIFTNCTTVLARTLRAAGLDFPFDWRILANGYLPEFLYERGKLNTDYTVEELRSLGRITDRVAASGLNAGFSEAARRGVPSP